MILWGFISDKIERRKVILSLILLLSSFFLAILTVLARRFSDFVFYQVLTAVFVGGSYPIVYSLLADAFSVDKRTTIFSLISLIGSVGSGFGYAIGLLAGMKGNWRVSFGIVAIMLLVAIILTALMKEPSRGASEEELRDLINMGLRYPFRVELKEYKNFFKNQGNMILALEVFVISMGWSTFAIWSLYAISRDANTSLLVASILLAIVSSERVFQPLLAPIVDNLRLRSGLLKCFFTACMIFVFVLSITLFLLMLEPLELYEEKLLNALISIIFLLREDTSLRIAIVLGMLGVFAEAFDQPVREATLAETNLPEIRGSGIAIINLFGLFGRSLGIILTGYLAIVMSSLKHAIVLVVALSSLAGIFWIIFGLNYEHYTDLIRRELIRRRNSILEFIKTKDLVL